MIRLLQINGQEQAKLVLIQLTETLFFVQKIKE